MQVSELITAPVPALPGEVMMCADVVWNKDIKDAGEQAHNIARVW